VFGKFVAGEVNGIVLYLAGLVLGSDERSSGAEFRDNSPDATFGEAGFAGKERNARVGVLSIVVGVVSDSEKDKARRCGHL